MHRTRSNSRTVLPGQPPTEGCPASAFQNTYFAESWKNRASGVLVWNVFGAVIWPPLLASVAMLGFAHEGWLNKLKTSTRTCRYWERHVLKFLNKDILTRSYPGPYTA